MSEDKPQDTRQPAEPRRDKSLNPALKQRTDKTYDTEHRTPGPADSASVQRDEGRSWPMIWLVVAVVCVLITLYILFW